MISLIAFLCILGISIIIHELGHFLAARRVGVKVEKFSLGFGPSLWHKKKDDTEYNVSLIPLGGYVKLAGDNLAEYKNQPDEYLSKPAIQRAKIIFCGPLLNYVLGFACFWLIFFAGYPTLTTKVGGLIEGFGAKEAGIQAGDKIVAIDGKKVVYWEDLQKEIQDKKALPKVTLLVLRNNKEYAFEVTIREKKLEDALGQKRSVGLIGITPADEVINIRHGFLRAFILAANRTMDLTLLTYKAIWGMVTGKLSMRESVTGPVGIFYITSAAAKIGIIAVLHLLAVLSVSLGIFNLLPLPVLDGGHIVLLAIEKIRGRQLGLKAERIITQVGLTLIISLALFATYNDFLRFFGDKLSQLLKGH